MRFESSSLWVSTLQKSDLARENSDAHGSGTKELPQEAQKGRPARPQRVKGRGVPSGYVEGLNEARTPLAEFFSLLLEHPPAAAIILYHPFGFYRPPRSRGVFR